MIAARMTLPTITADTAPRLQVLQARKQRKREQRDRAEHEAEHEAPEDTAPATPRFFRRRFGRLHGSQRMLALDQAASNVIRHRIDDRGHLVRLGKHDTAIAGILHETIDALVAPHHHMRYHVDPESRRLALADAAVEQVDLLGHLREQW